MQSVFPDSVHCSFFRHSCGWHFMMMVSIVWDQRHDLSAFVLTPDSRRYRSSCNSPWIHHLPYHFLHSILLAFRRMTRGLCLYTTVLLEYGTQARWGICDKAKPIVQFPLSFGFGMLGKWFTNRTSVFEGTHYLRFSLASIRIAARSMNQIDVGHCRFIIELNWISGTNCCLWIHVLFETVTEYLTIRCQKPAGFQERGRMPTEAPELLWRKPYPDQYKRCVFLDAGELEECFWVSFVPNK